MYRHFRESVNRDGFLFMLLFHPLSSAGSCLVQGSSLKAVFAVVFLIDTLFQTKEISLLFLVC